MVSTMLGVWQAPFLPPSPPQPQPLPLSPPRLSVRRAVLHTDILSSSVSNSQFFVSISNLTQKLALVTPALAHIVMGGE
jgi:hypothetical protein